MSLVVPAIMRSSWDQLRLRPENLSGRECHTGVQHGAPVRRTVFRVGINGGLLSFQGSSATQTVFQEQAVSFTALTGNLHITKMLSLSC